jgi:hypothetical protein
MQFNRLTDARSSRCTAVRRHARSPLGSFSLRERRDAGCAMDAIE